MNKMMSNNLRVTSVALFFVAFLVAHCYYVREMHFEILNKFEIL